MPRIDFPTDYGDEFPGYPEELPDEPECALTGCSPDPDDLYIPGEDD